MKLIRYKLGDLIEQSDERNNEEKFFLSDVRGMSVQKMFIETKADMTGVSLKPYKIVHHNYFSYVTVTSRNSNKITLALNKTDDDYIVSSSYVVFYIKRLDLIVPEYLFMYFNRFEFDRYTRFNSWGSARETFDWDEMCSIDIDIPSIEIQKKYVALYEGMVKNQQSYERGLEDLKLVCDAYIENLRSIIPSEKIDNYICRLDERNTNNRIKDVRGVSVYKEFREPTSKVNRTELKQYKVVHPSELTFVQTTHNEKVFAYAWNDSDYDIVVSSVNEVFKTRQQKLVPEYLCLFFNRSEFDRYARFHSWGSARETFTWDDLKLVEIPIPDIKIQQSIDNIYKVYKKRKEINERLKKQIKDICPILIKGSIEEAKK